MFKLLRIACSIVAALLVTACIFILIYVSIPAGLAAGAGALLFFVLTLLFKYLQEEREAKQSKQSPAQPAPQEKQEYLTQPSEDPDKKE